MLNLRIERDKLNRKALKIIIKKEEGDVDISWNVL
tara:strand:- start:200 stop:304 length:105 start_codon:yes stop_codon:yes gene_type:complete